MSKECLEHWRESCPTCHGDILLCNTCGAVPCNHVVESYDRIVQAAVNERVLTDALIEAVLDDEGDVAVFKCVFAIREARRPAAKEGP